MTRDKALRSVSSLYQYKRGVGTGGCFKSAVSIQAIKKVRSRSEDEVLRVSSLYQYERMVVNIELSESARCINTRELIFVVVVNNVELLWLSQLCSLGNVHVT